MTSEDKSELLPRPSTPLCELFREGTFFIGGGGPGLRRGGSLVNFYILGTVKPVLLSTGGGSQFFWRGKNYCMSL